MCDRSLSCYTTDPTMMTQPIFSHREIAHWGRNVDQFFVAVQATPDRLETLERHAVVVVAERGDGTVLA